MGLILMLGIASILTLTTSSSPQYSIASEEGEEGEDEEYERAARAGNATVSNQTATGNITGTNSTS